MVLPSAKCPGSAIIGTSKQRCLRSELDMAHEKLLRLLNLVWLLLAFPTVVAVLVGFMSHSPTLGIRTFLLIGFGIAILSPLLTAIIDGRETSGRHRLPSKSPLV